MHSDFDCYLLPCPPSKMHFLFSVFHCLNLKLSNWVGYLNAYGLSNPFAHMKKINLLLESSSLTRAKECVLVTRAVFPRRSWRRSSNCLLFWRQPRRSRRCSITAGLLHTRMVRWVFRKIPISFVACFMFARIIERFWNGSKIHYFQLKKSKYVSFPKLFRSH